MIATKGSKMDFEHYELLSFYNFTYSRKDWGMIISIQNEGKFNPQLIQALKQQPNVLILPYINQPLLLSLSQTKILHCSGGKNSLYEAFSHGKPVLISPTNILDQFYMCENIHIQNLGRCLKDKNSEELIKAVEFIERNGFFKDQYQIFMEAVKFEQNNEEDFVYWINYAFEQGVEHLQPRNFRQFSYTAGYEVDTHFIIFILITGVFISLLFLIYSRYKKNTHSKFKQ